MTTMRATRAPKAAALAAALALLAACGGGKLEGADTAGTIPNATGYDAPNNYDTAATPGGPDSTTGEARAGSSRRPGPAGDTLTVRPNAP